jgi:hypothetical protein
MRAHAITTKASTIVSGGILALSLAVVLLAATASTASAERSLTPWYCPPPATQSTTLEQVRGCVDFSPEPSFGFGDRRVETTSPAQPFALGVYDNDSFNPTISVSGDYAQTNSCPPTLSAGALPQIQGCLITVTFAPTATGPRRGTLSTGPGGPTVALTGKGVTTPTPWDWPLELRARVASWVPSLTQKKVALFATTNGDSTVVVSGGVKKTTQRLAAGEKTRFEARIKHRKRLREERPVPKVKIRFAATDEFGQTAARTIKVGFCVGPSSTCR